MATVSVFGPSAWRWQRENYIFPFYELDEAPNPHINSLYVKGVGRSKMTKPLSGTVLMALNRLYAIEYENIGSYAITAGNAVLVEFPNVENNVFKDYIHEDITKEELLGAAAGETVQLMLTASGNFHSARVMPDGTRIKFESLKNEPYFFMALILQAIQTDPNPETADLYSEYINLQKKSLNGDFTVVDDLVTISSTISNNIYSRVTYAETIETVHKGAGIVATLSQIKELAESDVNRFWAKDLKKVVVEGSSKAGATAKQKQKNQDLKGKYALTDRQLTAEEEMLVPEIPEEYQISEDNIWIAELIKDSTELPSPVRNFLFIGEAGTGKTESVKIQAFLANKPLLHQAMDPDTDKYDICQQVIPDGNGGFTYTEGPLTEALEKGYWCEVSEADLILKQGALGYINPLLDKTGVLQLNTGRIVKRHPEAVLFFTINGTYEGCRPMNKAVKDRCMAVGFELPDEETLISRVISESGYTDRKEVKKMISVMQKVQEYCTVNCIDDGVVGIRSVIRWATAVACGKTAWQVAKKSIISSWTFEKSEHPALLRIVETQFPPEEV